MIELDKRIISGKKPLTALDTDVAKEFIEKQCYFADNIEDFSNLDNTSVLKGFLTDIDDDEMISGCFKSNGIRSSFSAHFIVPCEWVKVSEKKYRFYTLNEFIHEYSLGDEVIVRHKEDKNIKHKLFTEFRENNDAVRLGSHYYTLQDLYDRYELYTGEGWKPFGIEEE